MKQEDLNVLTETIEHSGEVAKLLINSEISLNDGDAENSQKYNKMAQQLFNTMKKDVILEIKEILEESCPDVLDYDYPNTLELAKFLVDACHNIARYIGVYNSDNNSAVKSVIAKKIVNDFNTAIEIFDSLFNN